MGGNRSQVARRIRYRDAHNPGRTAALLPLSYLAGPEFGGMRFGRGAWSRSGAWCGWIALLGWLVLVACGLGAQTVESWPDAAAQRARAREFVAQRQRVAGPAAASGVHALAALPRAGSLA